MRKERLTPEEKRAPIGTLGYIIINAINSEKSAKFWSAVTGRELGDVSPPYIDLPSTNNEDGVTISIQQVPDQESLGIHIDIVVDDIDEAIQQIIDLGGKLVEEKSEGNWRWVVMQDPDGNRFCLVTN
jgi:glyoxalase